MNPITRPTQVKLLLFALIIILAGATRFADLQNRPAGLFRDEAEKGYNAWALATTGGALDFAADASQGPQIRWRRLPWMINVMGGKTSAIYQYTSIPFMWIGGLNVGTTRMASALVGTLTVALIGVLAWWAWGGWEGLAVALALALSPWHLNFSRWALEGIFVPFFLILALAGLLGFTRGRRWGLPLLGAALGWLFYSYSGAQPFVLAWGFCLLAALLFKYKSYKTYGTYKTYIFAAILFLIPVIPTAIVRLGAGGSSRLEHIAIWHIPNLSKLTVAILFVKNYFAHFSPWFLFLSGDNLPRHNVAGHGQLLLLDALLVPLGLVSSLRRRLPLRWALLAVFLCAPLPAAITSEGIPHALRSFAMIVPLALWSGLGLAAAARTAIHLIQRGGYSAARGRVFAGALVAAAALFGLNQFAAYWRTSASDPLVQIAFEAGERQSWEKLARERRPEQRVLVNGFIRYVPYYQAFFFKLDPRALADRGMELGGFYYFDPTAIDRPALERRMNPGDWLVDGNWAQNTVLADGSPLWPEDRPKKFNEIWVHAIQKKISKP